MMRGPAEKTIKGRHVLLGLIGFFGLMLVANGLFVYFALSTFAGTDSDPYRRGLRYNETLAAAERQEELGWQGAASYDAKTGELTLGLTNESGVPVAGKKLRVTVSRPVTATDDRSFALTEQESGRYVAHVELEAGQWIIAATTDDETEGTSATFQMKQRLRVEAAR
jgi:nitrogen fixation protein FixH